MDYKHPGAVSFITLGPHFSDSELLNGLLVTWQNPNQKSTCSFSADQDQLTSATPDPSGKGDNDICLAGMMRINAYKAPNMVPGT